MNSSEIDYEIDNLQVNLMNIFRLTVTALDQDVSDRLCCTYDTLVHNQIHHFRYHLEKIIEHQRKKDTTPQVVVTKSDLHIPPTLIINDKHRVLFEPRPVTPRVLYKKGLNQTCDTAVGDTVHSQYHVSTHKSHENNVVLVKTQQTKQNVDAEEVVEDEDEEVTVEDAEQEEVVEDAEQEEVVEDVDAEEVVVEEDEEVVEDAEQEEEVVVEDAEQEEVVEDAEEVVVEEEQEEEVIEEEEVKEEEVEEDAEQEEQVVEDAEEVVVEEEQEEEVVEEEAEESEIMKIGKKKYHVGVKSRVVYQYIDDESMGEELGKLVNGKIVPM